MEASSPADELGPTSEPLAFFLHSGAYSSFVLAVEPPGGENLLGVMDEGDLWGNDCVQLTGAAVFFSLGSDAVNQAIWVYLDSPGKTDPPERSLAATFFSQGEQVYLEGLEDMSFGGRDHFLLPPGGYEVRLLSWNLAQARDNFDADPALFSKNIHHELHFNTAEDFREIRRIVPDGGGDERAVN